MISFIDAFKWLNKFEPSRLTWLDRRLLDRVTQKISNGRFSDADRVIEYIKSYQNSLVDKFEKGEIWVECSRAYYDIGYPLEVAKSLKMAIKEFTVERHKCAVSCWMLGTIQWEIEDQKPEALINWKWTIDEFIEIKELPMLDRRGRDWYRANIIDMENSLRRKILMKIP